MTTSNGSTVRATEAIDFDEKGKLDTSLFRRLWQVMRPQRGLIATSLVLLLLNQSLRIAQPLLVALAIDLHLAPPHDLEGRWAHVAEAWKALERAVAGVVGTSVHPLVLFAAAIGVLVVAEYFARRGQLWTLEETPDGFQGIAGFAVR